MDYLIQPAYPTAPIRYFQDISRIPRGSFHEEAISSYLLDFAKQLNLTATRDEIFNVLIKKEGQGKGKGKASVLLQGHTDMIWEKNADTVFDFETQPLDLYLDGDLLKARGTTLGGDNGVAVAYMLAVLADQEMDHPPLECVFTVQEEIGLCGAMAFDASPLKAKRMINLDVCPDDTLTSGCAGGQHMDLDVAGTVAPFEGEALTITIKGFGGGHSGEDIAKERGNAHKAMARLLHAVLDDQDLAIDQIHGGDKDNAIPRECQALVVFADRAAALAKMEHLAQAIKLEYAETDGGLVVEFATAEGLGLPFDREWSRKLVELLLLIPSGPLHRYALHGDLVLNSNNLASVHTDKTGVRIGMCARSSVASRMDEIMAILGILAKRYGGTITARSHYPGWAFDPNSAMREIASGVYQRLFGKTPKVAMIHAGLECGIFREKMPGLDIVAFGPNTNMIHTPEESLELTSFANIYSLLQGILAELSV